ncbi:MAG: thiamine/thiamine pyrophosphate ABC transporter permease ThiP [Pseudomonadota bacterium]
MAAAVAVPALIIATALAVALKAEAGRGLSPADWSALRFTIWQALVSAALSVVLAIPVARALARRRFPGRDALITLLGAPFLLPVIVAVFGLVAIFGRAGLANTALGWAGLPPVSIYGAHGVILAHVFFNMPLATRLILQGWQAIPGERYRLAASLDFDARAIQRHLEWPMLKRAIPGAFLVIFVICTTSFAVALTLGGGPRATTVELAIYQALRFEFDLARAALLALIQLAITALAAMVFLSGASTPGFGAGLDRVPRRWDATSSGLQFQDATAITLATLFLALPMLAVLLGGLANLGTLPPQVWTSALRSLAVALTSTVLVIAIALAMGLAATRLGPRGRPIEGAGLLAIAASPLVVGTGLFILVFPVVDPAILALPVTALVNAMLTLPFALRALLPAMHTAEDDYGRLAASLNLTGLARLRRVTLPRISRPLGFSAGLAAALSMGDLGVITLFADPTGGTLPLQVFRLMGAYRIDDAAGASALLLLLSFTLFWAFDALGRRHADA